MIKYDFFRLKKLYAYLRLSYPSVQTFFKLTHSQCLYGGNGTAPSAFYALLLSSYFIFIFSASAADPGYLNSTGIIRIGIIHDIPRVMLHATGKVKAMDMSSGEEFSLLPNSDYDAASDEKENIKLGNLQLNSEVRLTPLEGEDRIKVNGKPYRGSLLLKATANKTVTIIEELGIEEYLYGVLPYEMSPDWPLEALKAQSVAARTFALANMGKFGQDGFDLSADIRSQVYGGSRFDNPRILEAVRSTAGEALTYKGKLVPAYFHACCGGHTTAPSTVWGAGQLRPLVGIRDAYCLNSQHYRWKIFIPSRDLLETLQKNGYMGLRLRSIRVSKRDRSGRALTLKIITEKETRIERSEIFRSWLGSSEIKSTLITRISSSKAGYTFSGKGWGHGAGLCQYGALELAKRGKNYKKILQHYYPGALISNYEEER